MRTPSLTSSTRPAPKITWWFDHHLSAFLTPQDQAHFRRGQQDGSETMRKFYDPNYISCCSFLAHIAQTKFGFDAHPVAELVRWGDIVDGALYPSAQAAVEMAEPAMKLTMVIESTEDSKFVPRLIPLLTEKPLADVLKDPLVATLLPPLLEHHQRMIALIRERSTLQDGTIYFDISDHETEGYNKFIPYYIHPTATYNVGLSRSSFRVEGRGRVQSLDQDRPGTHAESGDNMRALRRWRTRTSGSDQLFSRSSR